MNSWKSKKITSLNPYVTSINQKYVIAKDYNNLKDDWDSVFLPDGRMDVITTGPSGFYTPSFGIGIYGTPVLDSTLENAITFVSNTKTNQNKTAQGDGTYGAYISVETVTSATTTNNQLTAVVANTKLYSDVFAAYGLQGQLNLSTFHIDANGTGAAVSGKVTIGHANPGGCIAAGYFTITGAFSSAATTYGTWIDVVGTTITSGLAISIGATGVIGSGILLSGGAATSFTHAIKFAHADKSEGAYVATITFDATADGMIKIDVGGTDYYIPFWNAAGLDNEWAD
jgi:hypothetical protein